MVIQLGHPRLNAKWQHHAAALDDTWINFCAYQLENHFQKNWRCWMLEFTFEIVWHDEAPVIADVLRLPDEPAIWCRAEAWLADERAIWCRAEALALRIENGDSAFIRVKNSEGATVVRTGVTTALASIEKCSCVACPLKRELQGCVSAGRHATIDFRRQMQSAANVMDADRAINRSKS
jgi:hypothetical protein